MFNTINTDRNIPRPESFKSSVGGAHPYEGKDNPGSAYYRQNQQEKKEESKRERPRGNSQIDLIA